MDIPFSPDERLVVAMSGGVDSSVAAWMLGEAGHPLVGLFMRNGVKVDPSEVQHKSCCSLSDARDARMVAAALDIPFQAVDLSVEFTSVIDYFIDEYRHGRTPNPCAVCNRDLKFGRLLEMADELGAAGVATGHYARIGIQDGRVVLRRGVDPTKDQSYQLFSVTEDHLARTALPLGHLQKSEVRELAAQAGLRTSAKADSQEVCFIPSNDYRQLLRERGVELHPGSIVDTSGKKLGEHAGTEHFTIGQRRGIGLGGGAPLYVVELCPEEGVVVVGRREECGVVSAVVERLNWIGFDPPTGDPRTGNPPTGNPPTGDPSTGDPPTGGELVCGVQHRYGSPDVPVRVTLDGDRAEVRFERPEPSVTPGQGAAFYQGDRLIGGGWIASTCRAGQAAAATDGLVGSS